MHSLEHVSQEVVDAVLGYALRRIEMDPPLDHPYSNAELRELVGATITEQGIGGLEALRLFAEVLAPSCISVDHPRFLSFVPAAPTEASVLFDIVVGASSVYAGSWLEGAGAVYAENEALRWVADLAGLPPQAGGVFVSGGTAGNLSALVAARFRWRERADGRFDHVRPLFVCSDGAHSSVAAAARVMDADVLRVPADGRGRLDADAMRDVVLSLPPMQRERIAAVIATAGTTNCGVIDPLDAAADVAEQLGTWFHVDGAYGGAALVAPSVRARFHGVERADSFIVDPHKWLFAPYDCCALLYRDPSTAQRAHTQHAEYLDVLQGGEWNPSDFAHHLSRRARGLPFWYSLATHGTAEYREAVERTLEVAHGAARLIANAPHLELVMEPELSVALFRRTGWTAEHNQRWSDRMLVDGEAFVVPTSWRGESVLRICIVNPRTTLDDIQLLIDSLLVDELA